MSLDRAWLEEARAGGEITQEQYDRWIHQGETKMFEDLSIVERIEALGIDADRLKNALDSRDNWGALVYSFEYLTVLGVVCDAMQAAKA